MSHHAIISRDSGTALCLYKKIKMLKKGGFFFFFLLGFFFFFVVFFFLLLVKTSRIVNGKFTKQVSFSPEQDYSHALNL